MIDPKMLYRYAELAARMKADEKEMAEIKDHIVGIMVTEDMRKIESEHGVFTLAERAAWEYSPNVKAGQEALKALQALEQKSGVAKAQTLRYLIFKG